MNSADTSERKGRAPSGPGATPRWSTSDKTGVGTALGDRSRVWFTLGDGILNEVYFPEVDRAQTRDLGLLIADGKGFFSEERKDAEHAVEYVDVRAPAFRLTNTGPQGSYRILKTVLSDPGRNVVLQRIRLRTERRDLHVYALLNAQLDNSGWGNTAWTDEFQGQAILFARGARSFLALACSCGWKKRSAGYVGTSDGWQDVHRHGEMTWEYALAEDGNVALTGEIDVEKAGGEWVLALGMGESAEEAAKNALASLADDFDRLLEEYIGAWRRWHDQLDLPGAGTETSADVGVVSCAMIRVHEAKAHPGGIAASLSVPWGMTSEDPLRGGYHLVWPRDLCESAGGLLACRARDDFRRIFDFLKTTQRDEGFWPQNMWANGERSRTSIQMDEVAFPILLAALGYRDGALAEEDLESLWPMLKAAAGFLLRRGPSTKQDRWEEAPGYAPFTLATEVASLVAAADIAGKLGDGRIAAFLLRKADAWNARIEEWTYLQGTDLAQEFGVEGYYVRSVPRDPERDDARKDGDVAVSNWAGESDRVPASRIVSPDVLALVRFGIRRHDDPRILNTLKIVDARLKVETPFGPVWRRHDYDGYGEYRDGSPFDGQGVGRAWPLLTGERGHYEIAAGRWEEAGRLLKALERFSNDSALIPEQVWDSDDLPELNLRRGRGTGCATPLVWAHAECLKLRRSLAAQEIFDLLPQVRDRYRGRPIAAPHTEWSFSHRPLKVSAGKQMRIEVQAPARIRWTANNWETVQEKKTKDSGLGIHYADLSSNNGDTGGALEFTFFWTDSREWEGENFSVEIAKHEQLDRDSGATVVNDKE